MQRIHIQSETHEGAGVQGRFYLNDCVAQLDGLLAEFRGKIKLVYMDPPFMTGDRFIMRVRVGEGDWRRGYGRLAVQSFDDIRDRAQYLALMREVLTRCRELLSEDGMIFVHIDYRAHPHLRLLMDELFGEQNFMNEIIWVYQTGGRSTRHFSRKHDVILFYRVSDRCDFNIDAIKTIPAVPKDNHMRRHVDSDGRVYRSIKSGGRTYTYYDDDPVAPGDVWTDVSHLQQRDPERTGYDTQKPLALLRRIVLCGSRPGEWVLDPFAGSVTTLEAAYREGRNFIGIDRQSMTVGMARRRLMGSQYVIEGSDNAPDIVPQADVSVELGVGFYHVHLNGFAVEVPDMPADAEALDAVDSWSAGYAREGVYQVMAEALRSRKNPALEVELKVPAFSDSLAVCITDVLGRSYYYALKVLNVAATHDS